MDAAPVSVEGDEHKATEQRENLTHQIISSLPYRELKHELHVRGEDTDGTTSFLRTRLRSVSECLLRDDGVDECGPDENVSRSVW